MIYSPFRFALSLGTIHAYLGSLYDIFHSLFSSKALYDHTISGVILAEFMSTSPSSKAPCAVKDS